MHAFYSTHAVPQSLTLLSWWHDTEKASADRQVYARTRTFIHTRAVVPFLPPSIPASQQPVVLTVRRLAGGEYQRLIRPWPPLFAPQPIRMLVLLSSQTWRACRRTATAWRSVIERADTHFSATIQQSSNYRHPHAQTLDHPQPLPRLTYQRPALLLPLLLHIGLVEFGVSTRWLCASTMHALPNRHYPDCPVRAT